MTTALKRDVILWPAINEFKRQGCMKPTRPLLLRRRFFRMKLLRQYVSRLGHEVVIVSFVGAQIIQQLRAPNGNLVMTSRASARLEILVS
jgi:hypothetical protein